MTDQFPLTRQLGLIVRTRETLQMAGDPRKVILAEDVEAVLAKGVRVYSPSKDGDDLGRWAEGCGTYDTHTALLIGIEKIRKETAEELLRELIENSEKTHELGAAQKYYALIERAKRVLK